MLTFERGGFLGITIGDDDGIGRRPELNALCPAVNFSACYYESEN